MAREKGHGTGTQIAAMTSECGREEETMITERGVALVVEAEEREKRRVVGLGGMATRDTVSESIHFR